MLSIIRSKVKTLLHSKRIVFKGLLADKNESVNQRTLYIFKNFVKTLEEEFLSSFFISFLDVCFNSKSWQVDGVESEVSTASCLLNAIDIAKYTRTTSHSGNSGVFN